MKTKIGKYQVEIKGYDRPSLVYFTSGVHGPGKGETGIFCFWTAIFKREVKGRDGKERDRTWGRATIDLPPGDRFDRMKREMRTAPDKESRKVYREHWVDLMKKGRNVAYVRPSTALEIGLWMATHVGDTHWATWMRVG